MAKAAERKHSGFGIAARGGLQDAGSITEGARMSKPKPAAILHRGLTRRAMLGVLAALSLAGTGRAVAGDADRITTLTSLVHERLLLMVEVSRSKWNTGTPVEDVARERQLFEAVARMAPDFGLDPTLASTFFRAQIEAAKLVESALIARWTAEHAGPFADAPDQKAVIRPKIDRLTGELLKTFGALAPTLERPDADRIVAAARLPDPVMALAMTRALQPVIELCGVRAETP